MGGKQQDCNIFYIGQRLGIISGMIRAIIVFPTMSNKQALCPLVMPVSKVCLIWLQHGISNVVQHKQAEFLAQSSFWDILVAQECQQDKVSKVFIRIKLDCSKYSICGIPVISYAFLIPSASAVLGSAAAGGSEELHRGVI